MGLFFSLLFSVGILVFAVSHLILKLYPWHLAYVYDKTDDDMVWAPYLSSRGGSVAYIFRVMGFVFFGLALVFFTRELLDDVFGFLWLFLLLVLVFLVLDTFAHLLARYRTNMVARFCIPLATFLNRLSYVYLVRQLINLRQSHIEKSKIKYEDVNFLIGNSLRLIEPLRIPSSNLELRMIKGVLRMDQAQAKEIMQPLPDVFTISIDANKEELRKAIFESGYSKFPVYRNDVSNINNVVGILHIKDLVQQTIMHKNGPDVAPINLGEVVRPAVIVNEFQTLDKLLATFREKRTSIVLVTNEHGGVAGIVTVTDIIEEILGELMDEFDTDPPEIELISENRAIFDASISLERVEEEINVALESEEVDTLGGYVFERVRRIPHEKDVVDVGDGVKVKVVKMIGRRIKRVEVEKTSVNTKE